VLERLLKRYQLDVAAAADNVDDIRLRLEVITARNRLTHTRALHHESKKQHTKLLAIISLTIIQFSFFSLLDSVRNL